MMKFRENGNGNGNGPVTTQDWLVSIKSPLVLLNSDSADTQVSKESKESSLLLIPASRFSGTVDSIEESQDSWTSIFLDVILILIYIKLECRI